MLVYVDFGSSSKDLAVLSAVDSKSTSGCLKYYYDLITLDILRHKIPLYIKYTFIFQEQLPYKIENTFHSEIISIIFVLFEFCNASKK